MTMTKALFLGLGSIGQRHLRNLVHLMPGIEILAINSKRPQFLLSEKNKIIEGSLKEKFKIKFYNTIELALKLEPSLIFICSPTAFHIEQLSKCKNNNAYIFIEKPIFHDHSKGKKLLTSLNKNFKKKIFVGFQYRYHPAWEWVKTKLEKNIIGKLISMHFENGEYLPNYHPYEDYRFGYAARKDLGGGVLLTQIHEIDLILDLVSSVKSVFALGGHLSNLEVDVEDFVHILCNVKYNKNNIPISLRLDYLTFPPRKNIFCIGDEGTINLNLLKGECFLTNINGKKEFKEFSTNRNTVFLKEMKEFLKFSNKKSSPKVGADEALKSLTIVEAAKLSIIKEKMIDVNKNFK